MNLVISCSTIFVISFKVNSVNNTGGGLREEGLEFSNSRVYSKAPTWRL